jgi:hypothetical protein
MTSEVNTPSLVRGLRFLFVARAGRVVLAMFIIILFVLLGVVATFGWFSYNGYCSSQKRYLSDKEFFNAAIDEVIRRRTYMETVRAGQTIQFIPRKLIPYLDKDDFWASNPTCCAIVPDNVGEGIQTTFGEKLFGRAARTVSVTYTVNYADQNGSPQSAMSTAKYVVSNCGHAWNARH